MAISEFRELIAAIRVTCGCVPYRQETGIHVFVFVDTYLQPRQFFRPWTRPTPVSAVFRDVDRGQRPFFAVLRTLIAVNVRFFQFCGRWLQSTSVFCGFADVDRGQRPFLVVLWTLIAVNVRFPEFCRRW